MNKLLTVGETFLILITSLVLVIIINIKNIIDNIFGSTPRPEIISDNSILSQVTDFVADKISVVFTPNVATFVLWLIIGLISYVIMEVIISDTKTIKDIFMVGTAYKHPSNFNYKKYWFGFLLGILEAMFVMIILVLWIYLIFEYFLPFSSSSFSVALSSSDILEKMQFFSYSVIGVFTGLVGLLVFVRIYKSYKFD